MMKPTLDRVLLKKKKREEKTSSGIILAETERQSGEFYEVIDFGPMVKDTQLEIGDTVIVGDFMAEEVERADENYAIVDYEDILAICDS